MLSITNSSPCALFTSIYRVVIPQPLVSKKPLYKPCFLTKSGRSLVRIVKSETGDVVPTSVVRIKRRRKERASVRGNRIKDPMANQNEKSDGYEHRKQGRNYSTGKTPDNTGFREFRERIRKNGTV